ncbi:DUF4232 domain-containing protein [Actinacidiphila sp. bgisy144]|uniref:DUF4232 domain-containing protein n=1 Tax=Actinacidiphila sp. bgisy144 TaxID=3413791 RepID=UPI003EC076B5
MRTRTVRTGTLVVMLATAGLALAACGPDDSNASDSSSASSSATASAPSGTATVPNDDSADGTANPATTGGGTGTSGSGGTSGSSGSSGGSGTGGATASAGTTVAGCATSQLKATTANFSNGAGSTGFQIVFQNTGSSPCTLSGYPGVSFVKSGGTQLGKAAQRTADTPATRVTLIPNAHAYADVVTVNGQAGYSAAQCDLTSVPALRVYPPNQKASLDLPWNKQECVGSSVQNLRVGPVHSNK